MLVNKEKNEIAFRPCEEDAEGSMHFYKPAEGRKSPLIRIGARPKADLIQKMAGVIATNNGVRMYGTLIDGAVVIDMGNFGKP